MSNENLVLLIQSAENGTAEQKELMTLLWEQTHRFIATQARKAYKRSPGLNGAEFDDYSRISRPL